MKTRYYCKSLLSFVILCAVLIIPSCTRTLPDRTKDIDEVYLNIKNDFYDTAKPRIDKLNAGKDIKFGYDDILLYKSFGSFKGVYPVVILTGEPYSQDNRYTVGSAWSGDSFYNTCLHADLFKFDFSTSSFTLIKDKNTKELFNFELPMVFCYKYYFWYEGDITYTPQRLYDEKILDFDDFREIMNSKMFTVESFDREYIEQIRINSNDQSFGEDCDEYGRRGGLELYDHDPTKEYLLIADKYYNYLIEQGIDRDGVGTLITKKWVVPRAGKKLNDNMYLLSISVNQFGFYYTHFWSAIGISSTSFTLDGKQMYSRGISCAEQTYKFYTNGKFYNYQQAKDLGLITDDIISLLSNDITSKIDFDYYCYDILSEA